MDVLANSTDVSVEVRAMTSAGAALTGKVAADFAAWYRRDEDMVSIDLIDLDALTDDHADGGIIEIGAGWYRLDVPDAAFASGANRAAIGGTVSGGVLISAPVSLVSRLVQSAIEYTTDGTVYCARADIEDIFGPDNVAKWADLNNNGDATEIANRVSRAITVATNEFNDAWRGGPYELPITDGGAAASIVHHAAALAGVLLYEWRGVSDFDPETGQPVHKLAWFRKEAEKFMQAVKTGRRRLDAVVGRRSAGSPFVTG